MHAHHKWTSEQHTLCFGISPFQGGKALRHEAGNIFAPFTPIGFLYRSSLVFLSSSWGPDHSMAHEYGVILVSHSSFIVSSTSSPSSVALHYRWVIAWFQLSSFFSTLETRLSVLCFFSLFPPQIGTWLPIFQ